jgi:hypothetical protein
MVMDKDTEQMAKPQRYNSRNAAKRLFKDFIRNDNLRMGEISEDLGEIMQLTDYVLATKGTFEFTSISCLKRDEQRSFRT